MTSSDITGLSVLWLLLSVGAAFVAPTILSGIIGSTALVVFLGTLLSRKRHDQIVAEMREAMHGERHR